MERFNIYNQDDSGRTFLCEVVEAASAEEAIRIFMDKTLMEQEFIRVASSVEEAEILFAASDTEDVGEIDETPLEFDTTLPY